MAEDESRHLPALLHRTISSAVAMHKLDSVEHILALKDKTNSGLWVSAAYGLRTLCKTYLEMGADLNLANNWHKHPLQLLTATFRHQHLKPFLVLGEGPIIAKDELQAPRPRSRSAENKSEINNLIQLQRAFDTSQQVDEGVSSGFCRPGFSPVQMAAIYGHPAILELFQEHPNFALPSLRINGLHHGVKSGQCEIHRKASAVIPVNSRAFEFRFRLERKRVTRAACFADARNSVHSLSLAETKAWNGFHPSTEDTTGGAESFLAEDQEWCFVTRDDVEMG